MYRVGLDLKIITTLFCKHQFKHKLLKTMCVIMFCLKLHHFWAGILRIVFFRLCTDEA